jgi:glycosyltransferase involved in cell wall biosynthesis
MSAFEQRLRTASAALGDRLTWSGRLTNQEVLRRFGQAAVVVIPSRWPEPLARTAIEALAAGAAVIAYGSGGLPEVLAGRGLIVAEPGPTGLAAALERVLADHDLRRRLQRQAWDDFPFTVEAMAGRLDQVRGEALLQHGP